MINEDLIKQLKYNDYIFIYGKNYLVKFVFYRYDVDSIVYLYNGKLNECDRKDVLLLTEENINKYFYSKIYKNILNIKMINKDINNNTKKIKIIIAALKDINYQIKMKKDNIHLLKITNILINADNENLIGQKIDLMQLKVKRKGIINTHNILLGKNKTLKNNKKEIKNSISKLRKKRKNVLKLIE